MTWATAACYLCVVTKKYSDMTEDMIADKSSYVDLGLSVKWATCNLGANAPEEFGDYYAWGETRPKETFTDENYNEVTPKSWTGY